MADPGGPDTGVVATFNLSAACSEALSSIAQTCGTNETTALHIAVFATEIKLRPRSPLARIRQAAAFRPQGRG